MLACCLSSGVPDNVSDGYVYNSTYCYQTGEDHRLSAAVMLLSMVTLICTHTVFCFCTRCSR